jgi:hypothetical protein
MLLFLLASALILVLVSCQQGNSSNGGEQSAAVPAGSENQPAAEQPAAAEEPATSAPDTLAQRIVDFKASRERPPEVQQTMKEETDKLREQGISAHAVQAGQPAPDFDLTTDSGDEYHLSEMLAQGPVVLIFFRGSW